MNKLFVAIPVLVLAGASIVSSCASSDDQGTGGTGKGGSGGSSAAGTGGSGGSSAAGTGGSGGTGTGGSGGSSATGVGGSGGSSATGVGGSGGTSTTGAGGAPDAGTDATTATGGRGGAGGAGGVAGAGGGAGGAGGALIEVARPLNGQMLLGPCVQDRLASVCHTVALNAACPTNPDRALTGVLTTDRSITLGGVRGQMYSITLHVQGEVEAKTYTGGMDANATAQTPRADGFCTGGTPTTGNDYNVYMIRVTNPGATTKTDYFLNSLVGPGVSNHTTYGIDYTATIKAQGGATLRLVAGDSNCDMIKNCGPTVNDGSSCAGPITMTGIEAEAISLNPTFNFNTAYNGQWVVMTVKNVTSP